ncbi:MAG: hypothetical protein JEZ07_15950 [Phycisphaerae bacterium]|nr:hypothetical protein [Phycisphaerae bacterium]
MTITAEISKMTSLKFLALDSNSLTDLPTELGKLTSLEGLTLGDNSLTSIPKDIAQLTSLKTLYLPGNQIKALPQWITQLDMEIVWEKDYTGNGINLYGNPLEEPPIEVVKQGKDAIKAYFENKNK